jgi:hypothetical protein
MIGEVFQVCNFGVCSNSRVIRKAEASDTQVNSMLLVSGAFKHIIMFKKHIPYVSKSLPKFIRCIVDEG